MLTLQNKFPFLFYKFAISWYSMKQNALEPNSVYPKHTKTDGPTGCKNVTETSSCSKEKIYIFQDVRQDHAQPDKMKRGSPQHPHILLVASMFRDILIVRLL